MSWILELLHSKRKISLEAFHLPLPELLPIWHSRRLRERSYMPKFPRPDMSGYKPNLTNDDEGHGFDIGWTDGEFRDGRPYRAELWCWDHNLILTFFFSTLHMENASDKEFAEFFEKEGSFNVEEARRLIVPIKIQDCSGNELWSVNIFIGGDKPSPLSGNCTEFKPYEKGRANITPPQGNIHRTVGITDHSACILSGKYESPMLGEKG